MWLQELRRGEVDIFVAVLLSQLPSFKRFTIHLLLLQSVGRDDTGSSK